MAGFYIFKLTVRRSFVITLLKSGNFHNGRFGETTCVCFRDLPFEYYISSNIFSNPLPTNARAHTYIINHAHACPLTGLYVLSPMKELESKGYWDKSSIIHRFDNNSKIFIIGTY